jgi:hypothetical protein
MKLEILNNIKIPMSKFSKLKDRFGLPLPLLQCCVHRLSPQWQCCPDLLAQHLKIPEYQDQFQMTLSFYINQTINENQGRQ